MRAWERGSVKEWKSNDPRPLHRDGSRTLGLSRASSLSCALTLSRSHALTAALALALAAILLAWARPSAAGETKAAEPPKTSTDPKVGAKQGSPEAGLVQPASGEAPPRSAAQLKALRDRLEREKARLAELRTELQQTQGEAAPAPAAAPVREAAPAAPKAEPKATADLLAHPSLGAADVLYRLGRYEEARGLYQALAQQPNAAESDRTWALLQAGHCCRRLGDFDAAIALFQQILTDYPDSPWSKGHVAWALRAAQWDKRWGRPAPESGD